MDPIYTPSRLNQTGSLFRSVPQHKEDNNMERDTQTHTHKCTQCECRHTPSKIRLTTEVELTNNYSNPLPVTANREMNIVSVISVALSVWMCSVFIMGSFTDRGEESLNTHTFIKGATFPFSHSMSMWTAHPGQKVDSTVVTISSGSAEESSVVSGLVHKYSSTYSRRFGLFIHTQTDH